MKIFQKLIVAIAVSTSILGVTVAKAQQGGQVAFQGQDYNVVINAAGGSLDYKGCDSNKQCVDLKNGQAWEDSGKQGLLWESQDVRHELSWSSSDPTKVSLVIYKGDKQTMQYNLTRTEAK
ncbi:MAG TPA: hypothetical protein V6D14_08425 [Coleofasciculaceae cyanobacterium]|jgi:hypothetical protein